MFRWSTQAVSNQVKTRDCRQSVHCWVSEHCTGWQASGTCATYGIRHTLGSDTKWAAPPPEPSPAFDVLRHMAWAMASQIVPIRAAQATR